MTPIRTNTTLKHSEYSPVKPSERLEITQVNDLGNGYFKIYVADSKEGWVQALSEYFKVLTDPTMEHVHTVVLSYNSVRPKGERLKTFGGTASGHEPLQEMFDGIDKVFKNQIDPHLPPLEVVKESNGFEYGQVRPIHILDIANLIGNNVVIGGQNFLAPGFKTKLF